MSKQPVNKDIHAQLQETIAEHRRIMQQFVQIFLYEQEDDYAMQYRMAA